MNVIKELENEQIEKLAQNHQVPDFGPGDTLRVSVKVVEGARERIQVYEGVCIARKNAGLNSAFTVRKLSYGEGVERVFPLYSPSVTGVEVIRRGDVRRAKLYYLRGLTGKAARITEKARVYGAKDAAGSAAEAEPVPAEETAADAVDAVAGEENEAAAVKKKGKAEKKAKAKAKKADKAEAKAKPDKKEKTEKKDKAGKNADAGKAEENKE